VEFDRVVQVRAVRADGGASFGTGYLIAARLVLTSGHVLAGGPGSRAEVSCPDAGPGGFTASLRWWRVSGAVDAALIEIDDPGWVPPLSWSAGRGVQRFGELVTTVSGQPATARGFPRLQRDPAGRFDEQVHGRISPGTGELARRYEIVSDDPLPAPAGDGRSQWAGMSGAAVFCGALLAGVIRADRGALRGARLTATRIRDVLDDPAAGAVIAAHSARAAVIEPVELAGILDAAAVSRDLRSPAMLLRAETEAVGFRGRSAERQALLEWLARDSADPPVLVLTGPGGQGKSRLSRWLIEAARAQGFVAGQIAPGAEGEQPGGLPDLDGFARVGRPVLAVVDYAESRPALVRRLIGLSQEAGGRVRLLLLARSAGGWKTDPMGASEQVHEILIGAPEMKLGPLDDTTAEREDAFSGAVQDLARLLGQVPGYRDADWPALARDVPVPGGGLDTSPYQSALSVQMAALAGLVHAGPGTLPAAPGEPVEAILLRHEARYWDKTARVQHLGSLPAVLLRQAVAACCLCGAATQEQAEAMLARLGYLPQDKVLAAAWWLRELYPAHAGQFLGSLQPDRVAEAHASTLISEIPGLLAKLLAGATSDQQVRAIIVLARAALGDAGAGRVAVGQATIGRLTAALEEVSPRHRVLEAANAALPRYSLVLTGLAVRLAEGAVAQYRQLAEAGSVTETVLAAALQNLSLRYADAGQPTRALEAISEAVAIRRRDAAASPDLWGKLHIALLHQASCYDALNLPDKAREAEREGAQGPERKPPATTRKQMPAATEEQTNAATEIDSSVVERLNGRTIVIVLPKALGVIVPAPRAASGKRNLVLFPPQLPLWWEETRGVAWATTRDNQRIVEIYMTERIGEDHDYDTIDSPVTVELPPGLPKGYPIDIEISCDREATFNTRAFDGYTGTPLSTKVKIRIISETGGGDIVEIAWP
jgi:hypothetical protein